MDFYFHFQSIRGRTGKRLYLYCARIYSTVSLYTYGVKVCMSMCDGSVGRRISRVVDQSEEKKQNALMVVSGMIMLHFFKASAGLLMAVLVGMFMLSAVIICRKGCCCKEVEENLW